MAEAKRQQIREKVAKGVARNEDRGRTTIVDRAGERAIETKDRVIAFAKEHPVATIAGGIALGVLASTLFRGSPTRKAASRAGSRAAGLAALGAELALGYAQQALAAADEARKVGVDTLGGLGETVADRARDGGSAAQSMARRAGKRLSKAFHDRVN
ncbi:MAG: hypothetical protein B7Z08_02485 [Sphingomonadales bacterium 32-68-7]|nr:MAG: hypothetical protein B7Z33_02895 [Sphingomonadales bacterium 12-68-11]OYX10107.1 MAG: hypothetical protein B7Z08_02485 [Sphingomonadales bacterium 32-68-7]